MPCASQRSATIHSNQVNSTLSCKKNPLLSFSQSYTDLLFFRIRYSGKQNRNFHNAKAHITYCSLWDLKPGRRFPLVEAILFPYVLPSNEAIYNGSSKVEMAYISIALENGIYFCYSGSVWIVFTSPSHIVLCLDLNNIVEWMVSVKTSCTRNCLVESRQLDTDAQGWRRFRGQTETGGL